MSIREHYKWLKLFITFGILPIFTVLENTISDWNKYTKPGAHKMWARIREHYKWLKRILSC